MIRLSRRRAVAALTIVLSVLAALTLDARQADDRFDRRDRVRSWQGGDHVRVLSGDVTVGPDERMNGDVVAVLGSAQIDGEIDGDLTVVMGTASLGAASVVRGDVTVVGGRLNRADGSRVDGSIQHIGSSGQPWSGAMIPALLRDGFVWRFGSLLGTLFRVMILALLALALMAVGRSVVERVADRAAASPLRAGLIGFAAQILFLPLVILTAVVLIISIVGIPLLTLIPLLMLVGLVLLLIGFTGVAYQVGRLLIARLGWMGSDYAAVLLGVLAVVAVTLLARGVALAAGGFFGWPLFAVGYLVEYAAWTLGLGAAILVLPGHTRVPPPLPQS